MLKKRPLRRCYGLHGIGNQQGGNAPNDRTASVYRPDEGTVYSRRRKKPAEKYRESGGIKDFSFDGTETGAITAISSGVELKPRNPTPAVLPEKCRFQRDIPGVGWRDYALPAAWYDCTTWGKYRAEDNGVYNASGVVTTAPTAVYSGEIKSTTKTMLVQAGSTQAQNFAFDGMDDID